MSACTDACDAQWYFACAIALQDYMKVINGQPPPTDAQKDAALLALQVAYAAADAVSEKCKLKCENENP